MSAIPAKALLNQLTERLTKVYEAREAGNIAMELLLHFAGLDRMKIALNESVAWAEAQKEALEEALVRLSKNEPLQHIVGEVEFYGLRIKTDHRALIPRPETEELVDWVVKEHQKPGLKALDIGTGTGCIPIALAHGIPDAQVSAIELSAEALNLARENAQLNRVNVSWHQLNILTQDLPGQYEIIVSNPPYIPEADRAQMAANVLDFEPDLALFVSNNQPLIFYKRIAQLAWESLSPGGALYFEIHEAYGPQVVALLNETGYDSPELRQDLQGKDRMIKAHKP